MFSPNIRWQNAPKKPCITSGFEAKLLPLPRRSSLCRVAACSSATAAPSPPLAPVPPAARRAPAASTWRAKAGGRSSGRRRARWQSRRTCSKTFAEMGGPRSTGPEETAPTQGETRNMLCSFCSHPRSQNLVEASGTLVEPWWNPRTLPRGRPGPRSLSQTPKLSSCWGKNKSWAIRPCLSVVFSPRWFAYGRAGPTNTGPPPSSRAVQRIGSFFTCYYTVLKIACSESIRSTWIAMLRSLFSVTFNGVKCMEKNDRNWRSRQYS